MILPDGFRSFRNCDAIYNYDKIMKCCENDMYR